MSTEVAKSFTSKDLAETFPRQLASLEHLLRQDTTSDLEDDELAADQTAADAGAATEKAISLAVSRDTQYDAESKYAATTYVTEATAAISQRPSMQLLDGLQLMDIVSSDYSIRYSSIFPVSGLVFGDPLPWTLQPVDSTTMGYFPDSEDMLLHTGDSDVRAYFLDVYALDSLLSNIPSEGIDFQQFSAKDIIFPISEPFFA